MYPNILFFLIDSFRSDRCYGKKKTSLTPNIDKLIKDGVYFTQAISSQVSTISSLASIFTALHPFNTGMSGKKYKKFQAPNLGYIDILKNFNYHTYTSTSQIAEIFGLTKNFEHVEKSDSDLSELFQGLGDQIISNFKLNKLVEPWMYFIHVNDIHFPVKAPEQFNDEKFGTNQYDRTVSGIDFWLGKILNFIDYKKTLVIVTADHGDYVSEILVNESEMRLNPGLVDKIIGKIGNKTPSSIYPLGAKVYNKIQNMKKAKKLQKIKNLHLTPHEERSLIGSRMDPHHRVFDDLLRIPILFSGCNVQSGKIITNQVRHIDIFPTIMEIIGLEYHIKKQDGQSLMPLIKGHDMNEERIAYIETPPSIKKSENHVIGIRTSKFKYFRSVDSPTKNIVLFDLENDPFEETNIANKNQNIINKMEKTLQNMITHQINSNDNLSKTEQDEIESELKKLGYL